MHRCPSEVPPAAPRISLLNSQQPPTSSNLITPDSRRALPSSPESHHGHISTMDKSAWTPWTSATLRLIQKVTPWTHQHPTIIKFDHPRIQTDPPVIPRVIKKLNNNHQKVIHLHGRIQRTGLVVPIFTSDPGDGVGYSRPGVVPASLVVERESSVRCSLGLL